MRNSTIKPYRETACLDCVKMDAPDHSIKITVSNRCLMAPHFHYKKHQTEKYNEKQRAKVVQLVTEPKKKSAKPRVSNQFNLSQPRLLKLAEEAVNAYIRERDWKGDHFVCISCNKPYDRSHMHAGHFYSVGGHSFTRYNEDNIHGQCVSCNTFKGGNLLPYRKHLIKKIGQERVDELENWCKKIKSWSKLELVGIIQLYREKIKKDFL